MAPSTTPTRRTSAGLTSYGACTRGSTDRHLVATRPACGGAATTSTTAGEKAGGDDGNRTHYLGCLTAARRSTLPRRRYVGAEPTRGGGSRFEFWRDCSTWSSTRGRVTL